jgi:hypothetical protein
VEFVEISEKNRDILWKPGASHSETNDGIRGQLMAVADLNEGSSWIEQILAGVGWETIGAIQCVYTMLVSKHLTFRTGKPLKSQPCCPISRIIGQNLYLAWFFNDSGHRNLYINEGNVFS